jgi:sigma-B regulation protein RsbU (phosphoserine phosphatase)
MPWLVALDGGLAGRRFRLDGTCLLGRASLNHVVLDDVSISRQHAKIASEPAGFVVIDLGSANGTFVNDASTTRHLLVDGDLVRVGPFRFRFEHGAEPERGRDVPRPRRVEENTRLSVDVPARIVAHAEGLDPRTLVSTGGLLDLEAAEGRLRAMFAFVAAIAATLDADTLLDRIVEASLEAFPQARSAVVYLADPVSRATSPIRVRAREALATDPPALGPDIAREVLEQQRAVLSAPLGLDDEPLDEATIAGSRDRATWPFDTPRTSRTTPPSAPTRMHAPMLHGGSILGVLHVACDHPEAFAQGDLDLLAVLASQAGLALENARLHEAALARQRLEYDLRAAQQIQASFLPTALPRAPGLVFVAEYRPANIVGGDFYDVFEAGPGRIDCILGDVSGKGIAAALLMARVSSDLRRAMLTEASPANALARANRELVARDQAEIFVTAIALSIDLSTRTLVLANAGHMPPLVRRRRAGEVVALRGGEGLPLGLFADARYHDVPVALAEGDTVALWTDGLDEATNERDEQLGVARVERTLALGPSRAGDVHARLLELVRGFVGAAPQYDDLTLLLCGVEASQKVG